ncbi:MAG TPA: hypothetical protein VLG37_04350 [Candidatus Saccharimonadales bacterium]|nr:hypothetical protein [Candidatus Saccharimonadales bacterium]
MSKRSDTLVESSPLAPLGQTGEPGTTFGRDDTNVGEGPKTDTLAGGIEVGEGSETVSALGGIIRHEVGIDTTEDLPNQPTAIEKVVTESFASPDLWRERPRAMHLDFGLEHPKEGGIPVDDEWVVVDNSKVWLTNIYGMKVVPDDKARTPGAVKVVATDLETLSQIHERIAGSVLQDEHIRVATPTTPPFPEESHLNPLNNNLWLEMIRDGKWPIMRNEVGVNGELDYDPHDYGDYHLANMALLPREVQDLITEAADCELDWRLRYQAGEVQSYILLLPGEQRHDIDPYASGKGSDRHSDGISKIDDLTDTRRYLPLITYVVASPEETTEERVASLVQGIKSGELTNLDNYLDLYLDPRFYAAGGIREMRRLIADMVNFVSRHRTGKNTTDEAIEEVFNGFLNGVARVGSKIRGEVAA